MIALEQGCVDLWERGEELLSIILKLPGSLVLKSGLSAQRSNLVNRWNSMDPPPLDCSYSKDERECISKWIHDSELLIAYIVKIGDSKKGLKSSNKDEESDNYDLISDISESDFVTDSWSWPWNYTVPKTHAQVRRIAKSNMVKMGVIAAVAGMIAIVAIDEDD